MSDAEATVRSQLLDAIAVTAHETGLRAGPGAETLLDALVDRIRAPETRWAFREMADDG